MLEEIHTLDKNRTYNLVDLSKENKAVGCKWIFAVKINLYGLFTRFKVKLVAKGYTQNRVS